MSTKKLQLENFTGRLLSLIDEVSGGNVSEFSTITGVKRATLHNYAKGRMPSIENLFYICKNLRVNLNWLVLGQGNRYIDDREGRVASQTDDRTGFKHFDDIDRGFIDPEYAMELTSYLRDIEAINPNTFRETGAYIKGVANTLKSMVKSQQSLDRRRGERRKRNEQPLVEQRSGIDRRKASGL